MRTFIRAIFPLSFLTLFAVVSQAQTVEDTIKANGYLYEKFIDGTVLMKDGSVESAPLNYNTNTQEIGFKQGDQYMILSGLEKIDTVIIDGKRFIPISDKFYEVVTHTPMPLLVTYRNQLQPVTATADHNGSSKKEDNVVSNTVSSVYMNRKFQSNTVLRFQKDYWLKKDYILYKASNEKQITKIFPKKADAIRDFIKTNKTNFENEDDVAQLIVSLQ